MIDESERAKRAAWAREYRRQHPERAQAAVKRYRERHRAELLERARIKRIESREQVTIVCEACGAEYTYLQGKGRPRKRCDACVKAGRKRHLTSDASRSCAHPRKHVRGKAIRVVGSSAHAMTSAEMRMQVERDMSLPHGPERYAAAQRWTPAMRQYAKRIYLERNRGNWE